MSESTLFFHIFLAVKGSAGESSPSLNFKDWITIFTSIGVPLGGAIAWIATFYKQQIEALEKQYAASAKNLKEAYDINEKRLNSLLEKQRSEISQLRTKIKRLQTVYSIQFLDPTKSYTALELLTINLKHIHQQVEDDKIRSILEKLNDYCEDQLGSLLEQRKIENEVEEWLKQEQKLLIQESVNNYLNTTYSIDEVFSNKNTQLFSEEIRNYIVFLIRSMGMGELLPLDHKNLPHNQNSTTTERYIKALDYIKRKAKFHLSSVASIELDDMINQIIEHIEKRNLEK